ncbi:MAG: proprotein convertase P-domain-containing protein, partial [Sorangiineae bacterium]|nr:proprotein convertase P-domain-containing protein [Sorangiineae bacterium]
AALIQGVEVSLELDHDACGELVIKLTGPDATTLTLASRPGYAESKDDGAGNDRGAGAGLERDSPITFNDSATTSAEDMGVGLDWDESVCKDPPEGQGAGLCEFHPARGAAAGADTFAQAFAGKPPAGVWSLCVGDSYRGQYNGQGNLRGWTLRVRTSPGEALVKSLGVPASEQQIPDAAYKGTTASMRCSSITLP